MNDTQQTIIRIREEIIREKENWQGMATHSNVHHPIICALTSVESALTRSLQTSTTPAVTGVAEAGQALIPGQDPLKTAADSLKSEEGESGTTIKNPTDFIAGFTDAESKKLYEAAKLTDEWTAPWPDAHIAKLAEKLTRKAPSEESLRKDFEGPPTPPDEILKHPDHKDLEIEALKSEITNLRSKLSQAINDANLQWTAFSSTSRHLESTQTKLNNLQQNYQHALTKIEQLSSEIQTQNTQP